MFFIMIDHPADPQDTTTSVEAPDGGSGGPLTVIMIATLMASSMTGCGPAGPNLPDAIPTRSPLEKDQQGGRFSLNAGEVKGVIESLQFTGHRLPKIEELEEFGSKFGALAFSLQSNRMRVYDVRTRFFATDEDGNLYVVVGGLRNPQDPASGYSFSYNPPSSDQESANLIVFDEEHELLQYVFNEPPQPFLLLDKNQEPFRGNLERAKELCEENHARLLTFEELTDAFSDGSNFAALGINQGNLNTLKDNPLYFWVYGSGGGDNDVQRDINLVKLDVIGGKLGFVPLGRDADMNESITEAVGLCMAVPNQENIVYLSLDGKIFAVRVPREP